MKIKHIAALVLSAALLLAFPVSASATGSGNMNNGGGNGMGNGSGGSYWNDEDGVRVTVVRTSDSKPVSYPIDMTNYKESNVKTCFIQKSKLHYRNGSFLQAYYGYYKYTNPSKAMPKIITESGNANITAIRHYFCSSGTIRKIAEVIGTSYEKLTDGKYKLLLEPVAYFYFDGYKYAMTATEAALYDKALSGGLRAKMVSLTHQQLPLSMFLEHADLGYPAFHGNRRGRQSDSMIISQLGLGVVKFKNDGGSGEEQSIYRCDTDVITPVTLSTDDEINPDSPASVTFHILGASYTVRNVVIPAGDSQLVWVKWHTPSKPQAVEISVSTDKGYLSDDTIEAKVVKLEEKTPPNPTATDRNDSFRLSDVPSRSVMLASSWTVWYAEPHWVWDSNWTWSDSRWVDEGHWEKDGWNFYTNAYHATLVPQMTLLPDDKDPTAQGKLMKSGYGVKIDVSSSTNATVRSWVTGAQTAITYFPEFGYKKYWRILDLTQRGINAEFAFKSNMYSTYNRRVHFTPIWYPDSAYTAYTFLEDAWTPAGMLSANLTDSTQISGNVYDDWHIAPKLNK
jgi:hypothetical protein